MLLNREDVPTFESTLFTWSAFLGVTTTTKLFVAFKNQFPEKTACRGATYFYDNDGRWFFIRSERTGNILTFHAPKSRGLTDINGVIGIIGLLFDCIENKTIKVVVEQSA
jgi:hypothetical protein